MKHLYPILLMLVSLVILGACQSDDDEPSESTLSTNRQVNEWIDNIMRKYYLWYEEIPEKKNLDYEAEPETFFTSLLSDKDGKDSDTGHLYFSHFSKTVATRALPPTNGDANYGIDYMAYRYSKTEYKLRVNYVLPNSPAADAGIKRGDWIVKQNNNIIRESYSLISGPATSLTLGRLNAIGNVVPTITVQLPAARPVENSPFLYNRVYNINGKKIAYLVYTHFSPGLNDDYTDNTYNNRMKEIFADFKSQGATECILDLRYNGGGLVDCAQLLTSLLAPSSALNDVFCIEKFNNKKRPQTSTLKMDNSREVVNANLNLKRLYVIVSERTASASELVISALRPYMEEANIILIGRKTLGKNVGGTTFQSTNPSGYEITPIMTYALNKDNWGDYANGFTPDIIYNEYDNYNADFLPLGDEEEGLLKIALSEITGYPRQLSPTNRSIKTRTSPSMTPCDWVSPQTPFSQGVLLFDTKNMDNN